MSLPATHDHFEKCQLDSAYYPTGGMGDFGTGSIASRLCDRFPVHFACFRGDSVVLTQLLNSGKFDLYEEDSYRGWTPAHWAAHCGQVDCLIQLQGVGVNLNVATQQQHQTPLHVAAEAGKSTCLTLLLEQGVSIDIQDIQGETAAHKSARQGHVECLQLLRTQGGCFKFPFSVCNYKGQTPGEVFNPKGQDDMMCQSSGGEDNFLKAPSRKRVQFDDTTSATKRAKFDDSGSTMGEAGPTMEDAAPFLQVSETNEYPMDFNEETVPKEYAQAMSNSTTGIVTAKRPCHIGPDSSNSLISLACSKGGGEEEDMQSTVLENNNCINYQTIQDQVYLAPSSVVEHQSAVRAQYGYEKLYETAYETRCYSHFF